MKTEISLFFALLLFIVGACTLFTAPLYFSKGWFAWLYHDIFGWCTPEKNSPIKFDGCSLHARCCHCHRELMQDSQGNWF